MLDTIKNAIIEALGQMGTNIKDFFVSSSLNLFKKSLKAIIPVSYWICLFTSIFCLILYIYGEKKKGKYVSISLVIYFLLECIGSAF